MNIDTKIVDLALVALLSPNPNKYVLKLATHYYKTIKIKKYKKMFKTIIEHRDPSLVVVTTYELIRKDKNISL